jgi:RHS repeat-associated protein
VEFRYSGAVVATYEYDWRGLRTKKVVGSKTERYYYTGNDLTYITDQLNNLKYHFVRDLNGRLLQMIDYTASPAKAYVYIHDVHGNIIGLADDTGILVSYDYDAWGNLQNPPQSAPVTGNGEPLAAANPFRYSGYQFDPETGFYYLKYRYYVPSLGRFLSRDPVVSHNRYVYCNNNAVNFMDPLGLANANADDGGSYEKFVYVPLKYPTKGGRTGVFINESDINNFPEFPAPQNKQFTEKLQTPIEKENLLISTKLSRVDINTYYVYGSKQVSIDYYGSVSIPVIDWISAGGAVATPIYKELMKTPIAATSAMSGLTAAIASPIVATVTLFGAAIVGLNFIFKPEMVLHSEVYEID